MSGGQRRAAARLVLLAAGAAAGADEALAGAWSQEPGGGQQIATFSKETGEFGTGWRSDILVEGGLGGGWDLTLKTQTLLRTEFVYDERTTFEGGVRRSFAVGSNSVVAVQGSMLAGEAIEGAQCEGMGFEGRAAYGVSGRVGDRSVYANVEGAYRQRGDQCRRTLVEAAVGAEIAPKWRTVAKAWTEMGDHARSVKAEGLLLYDFETYSLGLGYRREISGRYEEEGFLVSYWTRM
jgi:hypothetical protein